MTMKFGSSVAIGITHDLALSFSDSDHSERNGSEQSEHCSPPPFALLTVVCVLTVVNCTVCFVHTLQSNNKLLTGLQVFSHHLPVFD